MVFLPNFRKVVESLRRIPVVVLIFLLTLNFSFVSHSNRLNCPIDLIPTIQNINCNGERTGSISVTAIGGIAPYRYAWNNGSTSSNLTGLSAGIYAVTVTDSTGCRTTGAFEVKQPNALAAQILSNRVRCDIFNSGTAQVVPAGGVLPYKYLWNTGDTSAVLNNRLAGRYSVTVTDANGCSITKSILVEDPIYHYTVSSVAVRCSDLPSARRIYVPIRLEELQTRGILGLDLQISNIAGLRLDTIITDTNMISSIGYFKAISSTKTTVSLISNSPALVRTIIRDTGRLMWLGFYVENNFITNTIHDLTLSIRESYDYGSRDACVRIARVSITDDPIAVLSLIYRDNVNKPLYRSLVPTSISTYDRVGNPIGTFLPDNRGFINFNKANVSLTTGDRRIADTTLVLPVINGEDSQNGFKLIAGTGTYPSRKDFIFTLLAADVNGDGKVTAGDLYLINTRAVMSLKHFKWGRRGADKDWVTITDDMLRVYLTQVFDSNNLPNLDREDGFMPLRFAAPPQLCQKDSMTMHWILLGDVNGNWGITDIHLRSSNSAELDFCNATKTYDGKTIVRMAVKGTPSLTSIYFDLKSSVKIIGVEPQLSTLRENHNVSGKSSLVSAYVADAQGVAIEDTTTIAYFVFDKQDISQSDFDSIKIWINGVPSKLNTVFQNTCVKGNYDLSVNLFPNPTQDGFFYAKIRVPTFEDIKFELINLRGQIIHTEVYKPIQTQFEYGFNILDLDKADTFYMLRVIQGGKYKTYKLAWVK